MQANVSVSAPKPNTEASAKAPTINLFSIRRVACVLLFVGGFLIRGWITTPVAHPAPDPSDGYIKSKPGPWGELECLPITISAPEELLPIRSLESDTVKWFFPGVNGEQMTNFLTRLDLTEAQRQQLFSSAQPIATNNGTMLLPSSETLFSLSPGARTDIYRNVLILDSTRTGVEAVVADTFRKKCRDAGVADSTVDLVEKVSIRYGRYMMFSGLSHLLHKIASYDEKVRLFKALSTQESLLVKLHVRPTTDVAALASYWGKGCWTTDARTLLESLKAVPNGARIDISELLPAFPAQYLYTFPVPQNPMAGPVQSRDCHWSSFNFFRDVPDPRFGDPQFIFETIKNDYFPIDSDPRYGDIILFSAGKTVIHSAVYLADDIAFTKNGENPLHPWMFSTIKDLVDEYAICPQPGESLKIQYYRNKYL